MTITLTPLDVRGQDRAELVAFLARNRFPFHVHPQLTPEEAQARIDQGAYDSDGSAALWIDDDSRGRLGLVILEDLDEDAPLFDLRLGTSFRRKGLGSRSSRPSLTTCSPPCRRFNASRVRPVRTMWRCARCSCGAGMSRKPTTGTAGRLKVVHHVRAWHMRSCAVTGCWGTTTPVQFDDLGY